MTKQSKVIIVTGATSGIGRATAIAAVEKGHQVMLAARHEDQLEQLSNVLNAKRANSAAY